MSDIYRFKRKFVSFNSTFKETSFDSENSVYLCTDESQEVIDFDKIIEKKYPDSNIRPKSFDALYVDAENIFCIEFKNQKPSQINNGDIQEKLEKGKEQLDIFLAEENIQKNNYNFIYCVIYKDCIEPRDRYKCGIEKDKILFELEKYKDNGFMKDIFTANVKFFTRAFKTKTKKELSC